MTHPRPGTVAAVVEEFVSVGMPARGLSERTRGEYARDLLQMASFLHMRGIHKLADVHAGHLTGFIGDLERLGNGASTCPCQVRPRRQCLTPLRLV